MAGRTRSCRPVLDSLSPAEKEIVDVKLKLAQMEAENKILNDTVISNAYEWDVARSVIKKQKEKIKELEDEKQGFILS